MGGGAGGATAEVPSPPADHDGGHADTGDVPNSGLEPPGDGEPPLGDDLLEEWKAIGAGIEAEAKGAVEAEEGGAAAAATTDDDEECGCRSMTGGVETERVERGAAAAAAPAEPASVLNF